MEKKYTVLLCEDEEFIARSYVRKLELEGYEVIRAHNGEEGCDKIKEQKPDLIILDLMMPLKSGFEVLAEIQASGKSELKAIPIIVTSNLGQQSDIDEAMKLGAADFLIKSNISLQELVNKVKTYLPD